jgi:hypothetical protein
MLVFVMGNSRKARSTTLSTLMPNVHFTSLHAIIASLFPSRPCDNCEPIDDAVHPPSPSRSATHRGSSLCWAGIILSA